MILTNSANGESIFKELIEASIADVYTPCEWQDYVPDDRSPQGAGRASDGSHSSEGR